MNVSINALFSNCYNYINNQLSNLSPLQKKIAVIAVAYFSCATMGYFIYRLYCFRARPILQERDKDEEAVSLKRTRFNDNKKKRGLEVDQSPVKHKEQPKKLPKIEIVEDDIFLEEMSPALMEKKGLDLQDITAKSEKENSLSIISEEARSEDAEKDKPVLQKVEGIAEKILLKEEKKKLDSEDSFANMELDSLSEKPLSPQKKVVSSPLPSLTLAPILTFKPKDKDVRQTKIEERLKKNCDFAVAQQEKEIPKSFSPVSQSSVFDKDCWGGEITVSKQKDSDERPIGIAACQGQRGSMEDASSAVTISFIVDGKSYQANIIGVFDGHAGSQASLFVKNRFAKYLNDALEKHNLQELTDVGIWDALKSCFKKLDQDYEDLDGTTATFAMILHDKIWVANVGDSRTILVKKDGVAVQASEDAKPNIERYKKKIEKLGGWVDNTWGTYRVNGNLAVARAIGDKGVIGNTGKCCVLPNPKITCYSLKDYLGGYLVLASDGLYDVATTKEVGQAIKQLADQLVPVEGIAKNLVYSAIFRGSKDNVSVAIVGLTN